jgi:hypothetical protein
MSARRNSLYIAILAGALQTSFCQLQSSNSIGGRAGASMRMGFGARGISMGNAMTAVVGEETQAYYNPAVVPFEISPTAVAAYGALSLDRKLNFLSYSQSLKPNAGISFSIINSGVGDIDGRDRDGNHTGTYSTSENAFAFSFGLKPDPRVSLGVSVKILYYSLYQDVTSTTAGLDFGIIYRISDDFVLGAALQDVDAKYRWDTSHLYGDQLGNSYTDPFPLRKRIGISWRSDPYALLFSTEVEAIGSQSFLRFGAEVGIVKSFFVRAGMDQVALNSDLPAKPSLGLEFRSSLVWSPAIHYAYVFEPYSPSGIHIFSLSLRFK